MGCLWFERPVSIGHRPTALGKGLAGGGDLWIESWLQGSDFSQDMPVKFVLGDGALAPRPGFFGLLQMLLVQTEGHCPEHDVHALEQDVFLGIHFSDVGGIDFQILMAQLLAERQACNEAFELNHLLAGVRELVEEQTQSSALLAILQVSQSEGVFDELVVEEVVAILTLFPAEIAGRRLIVAEHQPHSHVPGS